ncbi:MAG TPA: hypothetical protein VN646_10125 [Candidatus Acidoferrum sp.]|nr:hypothetical protein [Candidatus Acidoferrum sp.]
MKARSRRRVTRRMSRRAVSAPARLRRQTSRSARLAEALEAAPEAAKRVPPTEELIPGRIRPETGVTRGPRKQRAPGPPAPRLSYHKARSAWFQGRTTWPVREAPVHALIRERARVSSSLPPAPGTAQWESVGPSNVGGRLTAVACHPTNPERVWVGAAGGGVWFSANAGQSWQSQWYSQEVLNVGALAIDPRDPDLIYCGTGEANLSADSYPGVGIYQTRDAGKTWRLAAASARTGLPRRIAVIAIDPFDSKHLMVGGVGFGEVGVANDVGGMYTSTDGGVTWTRATFITANNYWCHAIVFDPSRRGTIYATFTARGTGNGIYRSADGGRTWTQLRKGLPAPDRFGRTSLALCPAAPSVLYAFATDEASEASDRVLGVFRSRDGGTSWTSIARTHFRNEGQISYGNTIAVHPTNPNHVLCGGVDLHLTTDGGKTWKRVTKWDSDRGKPNYAHADHHGLLMPVAAPGRVYDPNDGGLDVSDDGGRTWVNRSNGLAVTMYYDADVAQSDGRAFGGGAQDNGTLITTTGRSDDHFEILGGDGGWISFDPTDAGHVLASYYNLNIFRFRGGRYKDVSPPAPEDEKNAVWMAYIASDPTTPTTLYTGSYRVWRTRDDGDTWTAISPPLDGSPIAAIEVARADTRRLYVATENGGIFRSTDGGGHWSANIASTTLPGHTVTRLATSPANASVVFATVANFGHGHVFRSTDGGTVWADVDKGQLPDVPHHSIAIPPDAPDTVYVCNDAGVFVSLDGGTTWTNLTRNLPAVMVVDLVYHRHDRTLTAATYGRSLWRLALS